MANAPPGTLSVTVVPEPVIAGLNRPPVSNESLRPAALEFQRQVNATDIDFSALRSVRKLVFKNPELFRDD